MKDRKHIKASDEELKNLAGKPYQDHSFKVPNGYFEELPGRIMERVKKEESRSIIRHVMTKPAFYYAAAILIVFIVISGVFLFRNNETDQYLAADFDIPDAYMTALLTDELSNAILLEITEEGLEEGSFSYEESLLEDLSDISITNEEIIYYLNNSSISTEELIEKINQAP
jgi:hypothetical protein